MHFFFNSLPKFLILSFIFFNIESTAVLKYVIDKRGPVGQFLSCIVSLAAFSYVCWVFLKYMPDIFENLFKKRNEYWDDANALEDRSIKTPLTLQDRLNSFSGFEFCLCSDLHALDNMHRFGGFQSELSGFIQLSFLPIVGPVLFLFCSSGSIKLSTFAATLGFDIFPRERVTIP